MPDYSKADADTALSAAAVKIDLQGSLTLGSQVAEFLSQYFKDDVIGLLPQSSGRRSMTNALHELEKVAKQMKPCKNLKICPVNMEHILTDYVSALTRSIKSVFDGVLDDELNKVKHFKKSLKHVKKVVKDASTDSDEVFRWLHVFKRLGGAFLEQAILLTSAGLAQVERKDQVFNVMRRQLVTNLIDIEKIYEKKICKEFRFCPYQYDATIYLQLLLNFVKNMNGTDVKVFLNQFRIHFLRSPVFTEDKAIMMHFEETLQDMLNKEPALARGVLSSIADIVQKRLTNTEVTDKDAFLVQVILADLDHIYASNEGEPVESFMDAVKAWTKNNDIRALNDGMVALYNGLKSHFDNQPPELIFKLKTEAQVFLELTLDSPDTQKISVAPNVTLASVAPNATVTLNATVTPNERVASEAPAIAD